MDSHFAYALRVGHRQLADKEFACHLPSRAPGNASRRLCVVHVHVSPSHLAARSNSVHLRDLCLVLASGGLTGQVRGPTPCPPAVMWPLRAKPYPLPPVLLSMPIAFPVVICTFCGYLYPGGDAEVGRGNFCSNVVRCCRASLLAVLGLLLLLSPVRLMKLTSSRSAAGECFWECLMVCLGISLWPRKPAP
jgi:hypothetical protein